MSYVSYASNARKLDQYELTPPVINRVWIEGKAYETDTIASELSTIPLPFGKNFFVIEFISINYKIPDKLIYSYKLEGVDSTWVFNGNQRIASYANLGPGTYPIKLRVSSDGINWVNNINNVNVVVTPPVWAKSWFQVIVIAFILSLLWALYQIRINAAVKRVLQIAEIRRKESESLRVMMAQDFHDEMGNKLASIIVLVSTLQMLIKDKNNEIQKALTRIETSSKQLFDGTKSFIWSINPQSDKLEEIISYISNFGGELFEHTNICFKVKQEILEPELKIELPVGYSRQVFFIFKEAMTNSLVHSGGSEASLIFSTQRKKNHLTIIYEDDGSGLTEEQLKSSRGLSNMKGRAKRIKYELTFFHNLKGGLGVQLEGEIPKT